MEALPASCATLERPHFPLRNQSTAFVIAARDYILQLRTVADCRSVDELKIVVYPCLLHILG